MPNGQRTLTERAFLYAADAPVTTTVTKLHRLMTAAVGVSRAPDHAHARTGEVHASALDPTRAGRVLGWKPHTDLTDGIKRKVGWLRDILDPQPIRS